MPDRELSKQDLVDLLFDSFHLTLLHYALWFNETEHQLGLEKAITADSLAWGQIMPNFTDRIARKLGLPIDQDVTRLFAGVSEETLRNLIEESGRGWLACDGLWFQTIEKNFDTEMYTAKRINDTNWVKFSFIEGKMILKRLGLPENGGLPALREALQYRQYARVNKQEIIDAAPNKIIFRMNDCRVQSMRKKRGLPDYPCKSAGVMEYSRFAEAIDPRIKVKCIGCPPEAHPEEWFCAWEFAMPAAER